MFLLRIIGLVSNLILLIALSVVLYELYQVNHTLWIAEESLWSNLATLAIPILTLAPILLFVRSFYLGLKEQTLESQALQQRVLDTSLEKVGHHSASLARRLRQFHPLYFWATLSGTLLNLIGITLLVLFPWSNLLNSANPAMGWTLLIIILLIIVAGVSPLIFLRYCIRQQSE